MNRIWGFVGVLIAMAVGFYLYTNSAKSVSPEGAAGSPRATIDVAGVRNDLLAFANAEKQQYALEGKYLSLDELRSKGTVIPADHRGPWSYQAEISDSSFRIVATYSGPDVAGVPKTMTVDGTMRIQSSSQ